MSDPGDAAILFDLDGTLVDTAGDLAAAMNHALKAAGHNPVEAARVRRFVGHGARRMLAQGFFENGAPAPAPAEMDAHIDVFLAYYLDRIADLSRPFPGAVAAVEALREQGLKIAICTNKREGPARLLIEKLGLSGLFDAIVGADTIGVQKPDPAPVRHALTLCDRKRAVFVGDSDTDIAAASAAGMPSVIATFGYGPLTLLGEAHAAFDAYGDLPGLIEGALE